MTQDRLQCKCGEVFTVRIPHICKCGLPKLYWNEGPGTMIHHLEDLTLSQLGEFVKILSSRLSVPSAWESEYEVAMDLVFKEISARSSNQTQRPGKQNG